MKSFLIEKFKVYFFIEQLKKKRKKKEEDEVVEEAKATAAEATLVKFCGVLSLRLG